MTIKIYTSIFNQNFIVFNRNRDKLSSDRDYRSVRQSGLRSIISWTGEGVQDKRSARAQRHKTVNGFVNDLAWVATSERRIFRSFPYTSDSRTQ